MNIGNFAMLASIVASLVTVPAASATITGDVSAAGAKIVGTGEGSFADMPRTVSEVLDADSMTKRVETAFGTAEFRAESGEFIAELETPQYSVKTAKRPESITQTYSNAGTRLKIDRRAGKIESRCETPNGVLTTSTHRGRKTIDFSGKDRSSVEQTCRQARQQLESGTEKLASIAADLDMIQRQVEITGLEPGAESITIKNTGPLPVDLGNWTLEDEAENSFEFGDVSLDRGESVTVYSGDAAADCDFLCWDQIIWNDNGDTATLQNANGKTVATHSYGGE
jgi:hypothetical protein